MRINPWPLFSVTLGTVCKKLDILPRQLAHSSFCSLADIASKSKSAASALMPVRPLSLKNATNVIIGIRYSVEICTRTCQFIGHFGFLMGTLSKDADKMNKYFETVPIWKFWSVVDIHEPFSYRPDNRKGKYVAGNCIWLDTSCTEFIPGFKSFNWRKQDIEMTCGPSILYSIFTVHNSGLDTHTLKNICQGVRTLFSQVDNISYWNNPSSVERLASIVFS